MPRRLYFWTDKASGFTYFERINFSLGLGPRMEYYSRSNIYWGAAAPVAVEAFHFPFPNASLFFGSGSLLFV